MSYSSSSDTTNGREARDDFAEQGTVSSEDTSTANAAPTSAASSNKEEVKVETVEVSTTAVEVTTGGIEVLSPRQRLHQKYKLRVTEVHAKKKKKEPENSVSASAHYDVKVTRRSKATERLAKSRE
eukprot:scaffold29367_cov78-Skeletonema_dohrnii-CCMP3373.AAC.1